jgi:hypothetical protein
LGELFAQEDRKRAIPKKIAEIEALWKIRFKLKKLEDKLVLFN